MKDKIFEEIKGIGPYGVLHYNETKRFYDE